MELKDVLSTIGLESVKDLDSFKEKFQTKFITKDEAYNDEEIKGKITGKVTGAATTLLKRLYDLDNTEIKDKKWEEIAELGVSKLKATIKELEGKTGQSNDDAVKDLQSKLEKATLTISEFKQQNSTLQKGLEDTEKNWTDKYIGLKKNNILESSKSKLFPKLREMTELERIGFESSIKNNIVIEFDEKDEPVVKGPDGKRIANPNKIGSFLSLDEALELEAVKGNVIKKNDGGGKPTVQMFTKPEPQTQEPNINQRRIHPNALKNAEQLRAQSK